MPVQKIEFLNLEAASEERIIKQLRSLLPSVHNALKRSVLIAYALHAVTTEKKLRFSTSKKIDTGKNSE